MLEDKLTCAERLRLESFAQALNSLGHTEEQRPTMRIVFSRTLEIEKFLKQANQGDA